MEELLIAAGLSAAGRSLISDEDHGDSILRQASRDFLDKPTNGLLIDTSLLDYMGFLCLSASFAESAEECWFVAVLLAKGVRDTKQLPTVVMEERDGCIRVAMKHRGIDVPARIMTALVIYPEAMEARAKRTGAPDSAFYRSISKTELRRYNHKEVAAHHEAWEEHLSPLLR